MSRVQEVKCWSPKRDLERDQEGEEKKRNRELWPAGDPRLPKGGPGRPKGGPWRPAELQKATNMSQNETPNRYKNKKNGGRSALYFSLFGSRFFKQRTK